MLSHSQQNFGFNQMVDMYALSGGHNQGSTAAQPPQGQRPWPGPGGQTEYGHLGAATSPPLASAISVDHIARNAFISSQYKYMSGIRSQINQDILYTRLFNSQ